MSHLGDVPACFCNRAEGAPADRNKMLSPIWGPQGATQRGKSSSSKITLIGVRSTHTLSSQAIYHHQSSPQIRFLHKPCKCYNHLTESTIKFFMNQE